MTDTIVAYRAPDVCRAVGITYRQLDYWTRTGLVDATLDPAAGSGTTRLYSRDDAVHMAIVKRLLDAGMSLQRIRHALDIIRSHDLDEPGLTLISDGHRTWAAFDDLEAAAALEQAGHRAVWCIRVAAVARLIDAAGV